MLAKKPIWNQSIKPALKERSEFMEGKSEKKFG